MFKISIITPNYNYANYIGQTIESIVGQNYNNWEHIIVDDGSTDNSVEVINSYVNKYPNNIKLIQQENHGQSRALNVALDNVSGDIIGWINSDDYFNGNAFINILKTFEIYPDIDAVYGNIGVVDENSKLLKINKYLDFRYIMGVFNGFGKCLSSNAIFWRKELSDEIGLFDETFVFSMDSEYWSRLLYKRKLKRINYIIAYFRWHPNAKTIKKLNKDSEEQKKAIEERIAIQKQSYSKLKISRLIPFYPLFVIYRLIWRFFRLVNGHYFNFKNNQAK